MAGSDYNRQMAIRMVFAIAAVLLIYKALRLQVLDNSYRSKASAVAMDEAVQYPSRGLIYDREERLLVVNNPMYDLMVTFNQINPDMDTAKFCELLGIDRKYFETTLKKDWKDTRYHPSVPFVFLSKISPKVYAGFQESMYEFPGFFTQLRNVRGYPHPNAPHLLGYIREVNREEVSDSTLGYAPGDYIGASGLEKAYEGELRGEKGARFILKDAMGREVDAYRGGDLDRPAVSGKDLYSTIDLDLQAYGEALMSNKMGSIVAIEPATGEILAMVSTPSYDPNLLTINQARAEAFSKLLGDTLKRPLLDRSIMGVYPPGSLFKPIVALIGLQEGTLWPNRAVFCSGGYVLNGQKLTGCHGHPTCTSVAMAIQHSCNAYFVTVFRDIVDQFGFDKADKGLDRFNEYLDRFALGKPTMVDLVGEKGGSYPNSAYFDKIYARESYWKSIWIRSLGIGQGELQLTNLQMANLAAILANRGYYYTPHLVRELHHLEGREEIVERPTRFSEKKSVGIDPVHFVPVIDGMEMVVRAGTARSAFIWDIPICGKTGTAENNQRTGKDHSIFFAFAPKENPKIAIAVYIENGGWGGSFAAPIASLMIEKYIRKEISPQRQELEKRMMGANLIEEAKKLTPVRHVLD